MKFETRRTTRSLQVVPENLWTQRVQPTQSDPANRIPIQSAVAADSGMRCGRAAKLATCRIMRDDGIAPDVSDIGHVTSKTVQAGNSG